MSAHTLGVLEIVNVVLQHLQHNRQALSTTVCVNRVWFEAATILPWREPKSSRGVCRLLADILDPVRQQMYAAKIACLVYVFPSVLFAGTAVDSDSPASDIGKEDDGNDNLNYACHPPRQKHHLPADSEGSGSLH